MRMIDLYNYIRRIPHRFGTILAYAPILWEDFDWDHAFLLNLMAFKMRRMAKYHRKHGITADKDRTAEQLETCTALCQRLADDDYSFTKDRKGPDRDLELLTKLMNKHLRGWWD